MKHLIFQSRFLILLLGFLTLGISHVWGADPTESFNKNDFSSSKKTCTKSSITVTLDEVTISSEQIRWSNSKKCVVSSSAGKISKIEVSTNSTESYIKPMGGSVSSGSWTKSTDKKYIWNGDASSVTLTANGAVRITTITVTYSAAAPTSPSLTPSATSLAFGSVESGTNKSLNTLTVAGANLTNDITFDITGTNASYFTVTNPSSINKGSGTVSATPITIQYAPTTTGVHTATLQIKSTGADTKEVTLTGRGSGEGEIFYESFDKCEGTGGNDGSWSGSIASSTLTADNEGWTFTKGGGANKCAKFGTGSEQGSAETPALSYTGSATLTFNAAAWNGNSESTTLKLSATNATLSESSVTLTKGVWDNFEITVTDITEGAKIKFEGNSSSNSRFFLDEVLLVAVPTAKTVSVEVAEGQSAMGTATINGSTDPIEIAGEGEEEFTFAASPKDGYLFSYWTKTGDITLDNDYNNPVVGGLATETSVVTAHFIPKTIFSADPTKIEREGYKDEADAMGDVIINFQASNVVQNSTVVFLVEPVSEYTNEDAEFELDEYSQYVSTTSLNKKITLTYAGYKEGTYQAKIVATAYDLKGAKGETGKIEIPITLTIVNRTQAHVTFDANGKTLTGDLPPAVDYDLEEQTLPEVAAIGYTFKGWSTDKDATEGSLKFTPAAAQPYTLYAIWSAKPYDVIFNKNNDAATGEMANLTINYKEYADLTANDYELTGHTFQGWATTSDGTVAYADKANYTMNTADNVNLYAVWKVDSYTITYMDGDKEYTPTTGMPTTHTYGTDTPLEDGSKVGYTFEGWYKESTLDNKVTSLGATDYTDNITLYAKWEMIVPTFWSFDKTELTLVWNDNNNKIGYATPTIEPANAYNKVSYSKIDNDEVVSIYNDNNALKVTAKKEGTATYLAKADGNSELTQVITITVKSLPTITWLNANGSVFATTSATALVDGTVGALPPVDADHQPVTCDAVGGYTTFKGWSKHAFRAQGDAPTDYVQTTDPVGENGATFYAVFAKGTTGEPESISGGDMSNGVGSTGWSIHNTGTYSNNGIKFDNTGDYVTSPDLTTNGVKSATVKIKAGYNGSEGTILKISALKKDGTTEIDSKEVTPKQSYNAQNDIYEVSLSGTETFAYIRVQPSKLTSNVGMKYCEVFAAKTEYTSFLSSCCTGYDVTLTNEGTATGGTFAANPKTACAGDVVTLTASKATGYSFSSWSVEGATPESATAETTTIQMPASDVTVNASFTANTHNVLLQKNDDSGDYATQVFTFGEPQKIQKNTFERTGYKFNGWSSTSEGSVEYADEAEYTLKVDKNVQLYAVWTADDAVAVSVQGTEHLSDITAPTSISAKAKSLNFTYSVATGYKVVGVTVTIDGTPVTEGVSFTQTNFSLLSDADFAGAIVITFDVQEILNTITLNPGSGTCEKTEVKQIAYGAAVTLPTPTIAAEGWAFAGWAAAKVETETESAPTLYTGTYTPAEDLTLFAVYKRGEEVIGDTYTCDFETEGEPEGWTFSKFTGKNTHPNMSAVSGDYFGATTITAQGGGTGYVLLDKAITGKYRITASVGSTSSSDKQGKFEIKVSGTSWTTVGSSVSVAGSSKQYKWQTLTWTGDLNNQQIEVFYTGGSNAQRVIDNVVVEQITNKSYYLSNPSVLTSLTVTKSPAANIKYKVGETFNPNGIELTAIYDNDESTAEPITEGFDYEPKTALNAGVTTITLTYKKATCTLDVTAGTLDRITITTDPSKLKLTYVEGETFDKTNLTTRAYYKYNDADVCSEPVKQADLTFTPSLETPLTTSDTYVRISYTWAETTAYVDQEITVLEKVATPTFSPNGGKLDKETDITISCATEGATIYYTTDGSLPTKESNLYEGPVPMLKGTLRAIAVKEGYGDSEIGTAVFIETIDPTNGDWILVTDDSELAAGDFVIIASNTKGTVPSKTEGANLAHVNTTFSEDKSMMDYTADAMMFRLGGEIGAWTLTHADANDHIMGATGNTSLTWGNTTTATNTWAITIDGNNNATISNTNSNCGRILDNTAHYYTVYKDAAVGPAMLLPQLYKYYHPTHKIIYNANGVNVKNLPTPTRYEDGQATVTSQEPTRGGWDFQGWNTQEDGQGDVYEAGKVITTMNADIYLYAQWTKAAIPGTPMAVVFKYDDKYYAMSYNETGIVPVEVIGAVGNKVVIPSTVDVAAVTWYRENVDGGVVFRNSEEGYLTAEGGTDISIKEEFDENWSVWTWNNDGYYEAISGRTLLYNSTNVIKNYAISNKATGSYSDVAMFCTNIIVGDEENWFTRKMTNGFMGTHCYPFDIAAGDYKGAQFYEIAYRIGDTRIYFDQVDHVEAGVPYLVVPEDEENGSILEAIVTPYTEVEKPVVIDNDKCKGFVGSYTQELLPKSENLYIVYNNEFRRVGNNVYVGANRAYIDLTQVRDDDPQAGNPKAPRRISLRNSDAGTPTGIDNIREEFGNPNRAMKVFHDGNIYFIRESKIYNAQGIKIQ